MHVLNTNGAAVRIAQNAQQFIKCEFCTASNTAGEELALEIPDGEAIVIWVQFARKTGRLPTQRINVGNEVTAYAVRAHQHAHLHLLVHHCFFAVQRRNVGGPLHCLIRNAEAAEHVVVETVFTEKHLVYALQEQTAFGALNNAVIVRAGNGDNF